MLHYCLTSTKWGKAVYAIAAAVIGGTSLFGGRGTASSCRFFVTGVVLLLAVGVDSLARRSRTTHGRA